ncbi:MAG: putative dinucleotide-utilizing enzyme of the ThiF/HesA family [Methanobacterium sp. Maddingley MBC34]|nr:MAG: putative dinucleotide-utilizing enzyme of the ThiF/HesA family [Methanobacterium sp. Maddingley MBC34]
MNIEEIENNKVPEGHVTLVGLGRLGIRTGLNLAQVHRGGPQKITAIDSQKISQGDLIFKLMGGKQGEYKVDLLHDLCGIKEVIPIRQDITPKNLDLIQGDVVCVEIAGGNTIPTTAAIIKKAHQIGASTISTAGVFGIGNEKIRVMDISQADPDNPVANELRAEGIEENHTLITTGKFIRDSEPVTPYVLDEIARRMTMEILKALDLRNLEK